MTYCIIGLRHIGYFQKMNTTLLLMNTTELVMNTTLLLMSTTLLLTHLSTDRPHTRVVNPLQFKCK